MSTSLSNLSGICSTLATYKQAFEADMRESGRNPTERTRVFNGYLMDICNLIWRSRALIATDTNAMGCLYPAGNLKELQSYLSGVDQDYNTAIIFGPSHHSLTSSVSKAAFHSLEMETRPNSGEAPLQHVGPVTQRSLASWAQETGINVSWKDFRISMLDYLEARGANGLKDLMYATMKDLMR
jgi:centromere protein I